MRRVRAASFVCLTAVSMIVCPLAVARDELLEGFQVPPSDAKPRVWWHWVNGNVTKEGIRLDLEWMKRIGIGGVQQFEIGYEPAGLPLTYLTPEWRNALRYGVELARDFGLEFAIASSPGFTQTGGPWVQPHQGMKKLVWSETAVRGGVPFAGRLNSPPRVTGPFQDVPLNPPLPPALQEIAAREFYRDIATLAYPTPSSERRQLMRDATATSNAGAIPRQLLFDGDLAKSFELPFSDTQPSWIQFSFETPQRVQAVTAVIARPIGLTNDQIRQGGWVEASNDGRKFHRVCALFGSDAIQQTVSFAPVAARVFRVVLEKPEPTYAERMKLVPPPAAHRVAELVLHAGARVNRFETKAGFTSGLVAQGDATPLVTDADVVRAADVIDLTDRVRNDGRLDWTPPPGEWTVLRFGYSLTGRLNSPAPAVATGFEVDKLNREHVRAYLTRYLAEYRRALGPALIGPAGLSHVLNDSYEAGPQNWTDDMLVQFKRRRGYDAWRWMPVLAGHVVEGDATSDRFLWDLRRTIGELYAEAHYGEISQLLHERQMRRYGESHEVGRAMIADGMDVKRSADVPMGAVWTDFRLPIVSSSENEADLRESASVAHVYGKPIVAAEAFTAYGNTYGFAPGDLKPIADRAMAFGVNRFVIHASVHQPDGRPGPGIGLAQFGQWFTRKETWAEQAGPWIAYLSRSSWLLQQGRFVADIAWLYGEDTNVTAQFGAGAPPMPEGYAFDYINADALLRQISVRDGRLITPGGTAYRVLILDPSTRRMTLPLLRKIRDIARAQVIVVGERPIGTPSLADDEDEFRSIVAELWNPAGRVVSPERLTSALSAHRVAPDVIFSPAPKRQLRFVHRALADADLYFIGHDASHPQAIEASFRISGRRPKLWRADTGSVEEISYRIENGRTTVPLSLESHDAVFVVFRAPTDESRHIAPELVSRKLLELDGAWTVSFQEHRGAPARARFDRLISWTDSGDPGVKYFSGTATYLKWIDVPRDWLDAGSRVRIDLGRVEDVAEVAVNAMPMGISWKAPFQTEITRALRPGRNRIEIKVTNLWPNRLIGDKQPGARRTAFASFDPFTADTELLPSGLLGPVILHQLTRQRPHAGL